MPELFDLGNNDSLASQSRLIQNLHAATKRRYGSSRDSAISQRITEKEELAYRQSLVYRTRATLGITDTIKDLIRTAYNHDTGRILGKTPKRWGTVILFYITLYICLGSFFCGLLFLWWRTIIDRVDPKYAGPDSGMNWTPGMQFRPILDPERKSTLIRYRKANESQVMEIKEYMWTSFLHEYEPLEQQSGNGHFIDCSQGRTDPDPTKICEFKLDLILPCRREDEYGWTDGQPCIILKLNKVDKWVPENYENVDEVPDEIKDVWEPDIITVKCFGSDPVSQELLGDVEYYPRQGFPYDYYPFLHQQGYRSPLVAAMFTSITHRQLIFITCKAFSKNMVHDAKKSLGMTQFEIIID